MKKIEVLIVVDCASAMASGVLQSNVYLIDTNKYAGSGDEGQAELSTACHDLQTISWRIVPISPDDDIIISSFSGDIIQKKICVPVKEGTGNDVFWTGTVETQGATERYQYSVNVLINSQKLMTFDPFLDVKPSTMSLRR